MKTIRSRGHLSLACYAFFTLALISMSGNANAQSQFGQITGLIVDPSQSSVPGADIRITNTETGVVSKTVTNADGNYTVVGLVPGRYDIEVSKAGFSTVTQKNFVLQVAQNARVDLALSVGQVSQQVSVTGSGTLIQTENAA